MPYRSRPFSVKPYRRAWRGFRRVWRHRKRVGAAAYAAYRGVQYLKGLVNSEIFTAEGNTTSTAVTNSGVVTHLSAIAQGDGEHARTGNSVLAKYLTLRGKLVMHGSASSTLVRMLVVRDTQQVGDTSPALSAVLDAASTNQCLAPMNADTKGRFSKLYDRTFCLDTDRPSSVFKINLKLGKRGSHIRFNGTASSDIQRGGLYFMIVSDEATNQPTYVKFYRLAYHDN